jgi:hypothetical protein
MKKVIALLIGCFLILSACSADVTAINADDDPEGALVEALRALAESDASTLAVTVASTPASLVALASDSGDSLSEEDANKILTSSLVLSGTRAEPITEANSSVLLNVAGNDVLEIRVVDNNLYLRVQAAALFETLGEDPAELDQLVQETAGQPGFEFVEPAVNGEWLVIENIGQMSQQMGANPIPDQDKFAEELLRTVQENATVTAEGDDDEGTHLVATLPLKQTIEDLQGLAGEMGSALPPGANMTEQLKDIPEGDLAVDFWVSGGELTQLEIDITQFNDFANTPEEELPEGVEQLALRVKFQDYLGDAEPVEDAVVIDPNAIGQAFGGMMGGVAPGGGSVPFDCSQLEGAPPEVIELYAEECPELQP